MVDKVDDPEATLELVPPEVIKSKQRRESASAQHAAIVNMKLQGFTPPEIARTLSRSVDTVNTVIRRFAPVFRELEAVNDFRQNKADLLTAAQIAALKSGLSEKKLEKASALSCAQIFEIYNKAERLEVGKTTENIGTFARVEVVHVSNGDNSPDTLEKKG